MTDLNEIELSFEQKQLIAERAARNGKTWQTVLQEALAPKSEEEEYDLDTEFLALLAEDQKELEKELGHGPITIEEARKILSKVPGSMADDIIADADRGDR